MSITLMFLGQMFLLGPVCPDDTLMPHPTSHVLLYLSILQRLHFGAGEAAQEEKELVAKPGTLGAILRTHTVDSCILSCELHMHALACTCIHLS